MENGDSADCGVGAIVKHIDRKTSPETAWRNGRGGGRETFHFERDQFRRDRITREGFAW